MIRRRSPASDPRDAALTEAVESGAVAGVTGMVIGRDGPLHVGSAGERSLGGGEPMRPDTVMLIASMTKLLTTIAAMRLLEAGRIDMDAPAASYVPAIGDLRVLAGWRDEAPVLRPPDRPVTIRHLATHTAGMPYALWSAAQARYNAHAAIPSVTTGDPKSLMGALTADPGTRWDYGIATDWLAQVVRAVDGRSIGAYVRGEILEPLGMSDTGYRVTPSMRRRLAAVHARAPDGGLAPRDFHRLQEPPVEEGGGGLYSTAADYAKVLTLLLNGGYAFGVRLLHEETVAMIARPAVGDVPIRRMASTAPDLAADLDLLPGTGATFGPGGLILTEAAPTGRSAGSMSWAGIANTWFWVDPIRGIAGLWMSQTLPFLDPRVRDACLAYEAAAYAMLDAAG